MVLPLWRSLHSVNLMLPKEDRKAMLLRLYNEIVPLENTTSKKQGAVANGGTESRDGGHGRNREPPEPAEVPGGRYDLQEVMDATSDEAERVEEGMGEPGLGVDED